MCKVFKVEGKKGAIRGGGLQNRIQTRISVSGSKTHIYAYGFTNTSHNE